MRRIDTSLLDRPSVIAFVRRPMSDMDSQAVQSVAAIIEDVRQRGDEALRDLTQRFDRAVIDDIEVPAADIASAAASVPQSVRDALSTAAERIRAFHLRQRPQSWLSMTPGDITGQMITPLHRAGLYIPGGTAAYPSSVLMCAIPARVAGVDELVMCTPPRADGSANPLVLTAASIAGVDRVFRVGGAQAVAAMAYGTATIPQVDKIAGPGNLYVTLAKRQVFGVVGIDMLAGPSEVCIVADGSANPEYVALDLLSQAEHDPHTAAFLITSDGWLADQVEEQVSRLTAEMPRKDVLDQTLECNGGIVLTRDLAESIEIANACAPEHLSLQVSDPWAVLPQIRCAGAVLLGSYAPQSFGDYVAGPSHTLPTSGTARFSSPLNVEDFLKRTSVIASDFATLNRLAPVIDTIANEEGFEAHRQAALRRLQP